MKNIKIGSKLMVAFLFIAALTAFMGIYLIESLETLDKESDFLYEKGAVPLGMLVKTAEQVQELRIDIRRWQLAKTAESRANLVNDMNQTHIKAKELLNKQKELVIKESGKKFFDDLAAAVDKYMMEVHNYVRMARIDSATGLNIEDLPLGVLNAAGAMSKALDAAVEAKVSSTEKVSKDTNIRTDNDKRVAITLLVAVLIISISFGLFLTLSITRPLHAVVNALSKIEKGNMTIRTNLNRGDELGVLSKALDSLSERLQTIFRNLRQNSDTLAGSAEELSNISKQLSGGAEETSAKTMSVSSAIEQVSVNIKSIASTAEESAANLMNVSSSVEQVSDNINAMTSGAEEASVNASEVAGAAEQMSVNMNTIASSVEEMSASINQIANNAIDARKIATEATVESGNATEAMNKLGVAAKEIGKVTDVIKKIADKTNLLALNATIEAASAGAAGRGFAVVASEIKDLANQSTISADDIARRIESIQSGTNDAVTVIGAVSEIITKINQSVDIISGHVDQQTKASNEIANNVAQVNVGAKRVAGAISEVAKGSKDMSRGAAEVAKNSISAENTRQINQGADELARLASDLKNVLSHFKV